MCFDKNNNLIIQYNENIKLRNQFDYSFTLKPSNDKKFISNAVYGYRL